jgi:hypothetical protein
MIQFLQYSLMHRAHCVSLAFPPIHHQFSVSQSFRHRSFQFQLWNKVLHFLREVLQKTICEEQTLEDVVRKSKKSGYLLYGTDTWTDTVEVQGTVHLQNVLRQSGELSRYLDVCGHVPIFLSI